MAARKISSVIVLVVLAGCDGLKPDETTKDRGQCKVPVADGPMTPADNSVPKNGAATPTSAQETLPINGSALFLVPDNGDAIPPDEGGAANPPPHPHVPSDSVMQPADPNPDVTVPFPVDECKAPGSYPQGIDPAVDPKYPTGTDPDQCTTLALDNDAGAAAPTNPASDAKPAPSNYGSCPSDVTLTKNVPSTGHNTTLNLDWKVLEGLLNYEEAKVGCAAVGTDWHLAEAVELDQLLGSSGFSAAVEVNCTTTFWAAGAYDRYNSCLADYRGREYQGDITSPLPMNQQIDISPLAGQASVLERRSALCVKGTVKPQVACRDSVNQFFSQRPLGAKDPSTGLTWALITVKTFNSAAGVETQCALGATQGWRMPLRAELEAAVKGNLFKTAAYQGLDSTCPTAWHKPDDAVTNVTCGKLAVDAAGAVAFATGTGCGVFADQPAPVSNVSTPSYTQTLGLCVQDPVH